VARGCCGFAKRFDRTAEHGEQQPELLHELGITSLHSRRQLCEIQWLRVVRPGWIEPAASRSSPECDTSRVDPSVWRSQLLFLAGRKSGSQTLPGSEFLKGSKQYLDGRGGFLER